tara:strand:- start:8426 stop:10006 length:1581 start_codon:yes stop_codon:yes gene_type:complete
MALTFTYGDYVFDPKPLFTISKEHIKTASQMGLGTKYVVTLEGEVIPATGRIPGGDPGEGVNSVFSGLDELSRAFDSDFKLLLLQCTDSSPIISGYPRVTECNIDNASDNYVIRGNYSISLELPSLTGSGFDPVGPASDTFSCGVSGLDFSEYGIISYSDDFTVEFMDERVGGADLVVPGALPGVIGELPSVFSIQRSISAQGDSYAAADEGGACYEYIHPWQRASGFIIPRLGFPPEIVELSGLLCPSGQVSNNFRSVNVNKTEGSVTVNETYIAVTGTDPAYEDFEINTSQTLGEPYITVTIDGTVNGLTQIGYEGLPASGVPKFNNAIAYWSGISGALFSRASKVLLATPPLLGHVGAPVGGGFPSNTLNNLELSKTVGYNPVAGTVTYSCTYDNRPAHCYASALTEDITFSESEPNDVFASLTILGKASGPLYQTIGTIGPRTRELSINAVLPMATDCATTGADGGGGFFNAPDVYDTMVLNYEDILNWNYDQVFVTASSKTWEPKTGRFSLNQSWTVGSCT